MTPRGPILASFWLGGTTCRKRGLAERWALMLGAAVGKHYGSIETIEAELTPGPGFAQALERDEVGGHALDIGRRVQLDHGDADAPHATMVPTVNADD